MPGTGAGAPAAAPGQSALNAAKKLNDANKQVKEAKQSGDKAAVDAARDQREQELVTAGAEAALSAYVGDQVASAVMRSKLGQWAVRRSRKKVRMALAIIAAIVLTPIIVIIGLIGAAATASFMGAFGSSYLWDVKGDPAQLDIPEAYFDAYYKAGQKENVPWTLLAAAGAVGSYQGRIDPYKQPVPDPVPRLGGLTGAGLVVMGTADGVVWPVEKPSIGTQYDARGPMWSIDRNSAGEGLHKGVDFRAGDGTPIYAVNAGRVTVAGTDSQSWCGVHVVIDHGNNVQSWYCHMSQVVVAKGQQLTSGTQVGYSGHTGNVSGPHLHFAMMQNGQWADPNVYLRGAGSPTTDGGKASFVDVAQTTATGTPAGVYLLGDKLASGVSTALKSALTGAALSVHAKDGGTAGWASDELGGNPPSPSDVVVVAFTPSGTATDYGRGVARVMNAIPDTTIVYWVNATGPNADAYNTELDGRQKMFSKNLRIIPWSSQSTALGASATSSALADFIVQNVNGELSANRVTAGGGHTTLTLSGPGILPDPTGSCPTLDPGIKGASRTQGAGPLMLAPAQLDSLGIAYDEDSLQNICVSVDLLAKALRSTAETVAQEKGMTYPDSFYQLREDADKGDEQAETTVQEFWAEVVNKVDIFGDTGDKRCDAPIKSDELTALETARTELATARALKDKDREAAALKTWDPVKWAELHKQWVSQAIGTIWPCELADARLHSAVDGAMTNGIMQFTELSRLNARTRAVDEAMNVAWAASQWGTAPCDATSAFGGVFPLSNAVFSQFVPERISDKTRCDEEANILAAARAFKTGEKVPLNQRPLGASGWEVAYGGWSMFGTAVVGPDAVQDDFRDNGRRDAVDILPECQVAAATVVFETALDPKNPLRKVDARALQNYARGGASLGRLTGIYDTYLGKMVARKKASIPNCVTYTNAQWLTALNTVNGEYGATDTTAAQAAASMAPSDGSALDRPGQPGDVLMAAKKRIADRYAMQVDGVPHLGTTALLDRVSPRALIVSDMPAPTQPDAEKDLGSKLVTIAVGVYGGLWPTKTAGMLAGAIGVPGNSNLALAALEYAKSRVGKSAYIAGRIGPWAFDCSGLVYAAYKAAGLNWPHVDYGVSYAQYWPGKYTNAKKPYYTVRISEDQVQPGDLVFFDLHHNGERPRGLAGAEGIDHVGIVEDPVAGTMINASSPGVGIVRANYKSGYYQSTGDGLIGFARVIDPFAPQAGIGGSAVFTLDNTPIVLKGCPNKLANLLAAAGFDGQKLRIAWAVAMRESGGRPEAHNTNRATGDNSYGLFQINMIDSLGPDRSAKFLQYVRGYRVYDDLLNPLVNARAAYYMTGHGENWYHWDIDETGYNHGAAAPRFREKYALFPTACLG